MGSFTYSAGYLIKNTCTDREGSNAFYWLLVGFMVRSIARYWLKTVTVGFCKMEKGLAVNSLFVVPRAGIEPARPYGHKILSLERLPIPPSRLEKGRGGDNRSRTDLKGFADLCLTAWLCRLPCCETVNCLISP
jgi:hypothetical protein